MVGCPSKDNHQTVPKNPRVGKKATIFGTGYLDYPARQLTHAPPEASHATHPKSSDS
jgi:hypothetical protein